MKPRIIKTEDMYEDALSYVESLMDAKPGSNQESELELWALLIEQYEKEHHPIDDPDPIEAIRFRMDQLGLKQKDLENLIGQKSKVSEVLNHKRPLSLSMIRALNARLGIPVDVLVREINITSDKRKLKSPRQGKDVSNKARKRKSATAS